MQNYILEFSVFSGALSVGYGKCLVTLQHDLSKCLGLSYGNTSLSFKKCGHLNRTLNQILPEGMEAYFLTPHHYI